MHWIEQGIGLRADINLRGAGYVHSNPIQDTLLAIARNEVHLEAR